MSLAPAQRSDIQSQIVAISSAVGAVVRGKDDVVELALTAVLAGGHLLLQDVPGVGKTTLAAALASALGGTFSRIQFTSDLLPGDITGVGMPDGSGNFAFKPGPIFANVVLADEINRTTPRTQSALFEAMAEGQITVDGHSHQLPSPFMVVATQNPFDHHGTYALPESQLDRFIMRLHLGYPSREAERQVLRMSRGAQAVQAALSIGQLLELRQAAAEVTVAPAIEDYLLDLVRGTRTDARILRGVSTRGALALFRAVRAFALVRGRAFVIPEDVRALAAPVLAHRVLPRTGAGPNGSGGVYAVLALLSELQPPL